VVADRVTRSGGVEDAGLTDHIARHPRDAVAVSVAVPTIAFSGLAGPPERAWELVDGLAPAYGDDWWFAGLLAFVRQEQERWDDAAALAERALGEAPASGHAAHALAHVRYETGRHADGLAWLDAWIASCGRSASHRAHFSWHAALHELALGRHTAALTRFRSQLAPPEVTGMRALVDSASLLWRARMLEAWPREVVDDEVARVLAVVPEHLLSRPTTPFAALHAALLLAAADDCRGLAGLRRLAAAHPSEVFRRTVAHLADALADLLHGDADRAAERLAALPGVAGLGGSAAQREIIGQTLARCRADAGRTEPAVSAASRGGCAPATPAGSSPADR
jgi:hypothetical protein